MFHTKIRPIHRPKDFTKHIRRQQLILARNYIQFASINNLLFQTRCKQWWRWLWGNGYGKCDQKKLQQAGWLLKWNYQSKLWNVLWFTPFTDDHAKTPNNLQGHTWRTVEGVGPLCLIHFVTDFHVVRIVHYILYHVLQYCVTWKHWIHLWAVVFLLR